MSPRALKEIVRPLLQSDAFARPLNFTVRVHLGMQKHFRREALLLFLWPLLILAIGFIVAVVLSAREHLRY